MIGRCVLRHRRFRNRSPDPVAALPYRRILTLISGALSLFVSDMARFTLRFHFEIFRVKLFIVAFIDKCELGFRLRLYCVFVRFWVIENLSPFSPLTLCVVVV